MPARALIAIVTCVALLSAVSWPYRAGAQAPVDPQLEEAKRHFEAGKNAYTAGNYQRAIQEFKAAELLRPSPLLDYNIGLAHEQLGHSRVAIKYYQRYLQGLPQAPNRAEIEARIKQLEQRAAVPHPEAQPAPVEPPPNELPSDAPTTGSDPYASQAPAVAPPQQPAHKRSLWWVPLVVVGGCLLLAAIILVAIYVPTTRLANTADHALAAPARAPPMERTPGTFTLLRF